MARARRRVERHPPDFDAQEETAKAFAEMHGRMWCPQIVDLKRTEGGGVAFLLKDRREDYLMLEIRGLHVADVGTRTQFRTRKEVVT